MESDYQHSSGSHRKRPVFYTQHAYNIWRKSGHPFLCSPYPAENNNPKSRFTFALKSQMAELKEAKFRVPKPLLEPSENIKKMFLH